MSKISNKTKEDMAKDYSVSSDSSSEDESMDHEAREETPDLYRNSALGMYGGVSISCRQLSLLLIFL
jgi:E3 ubiquitin-protein ligase HUWE1